MEEIRGAVSAGIVGSSGYARGAQTWARYRELGLPLR